MSLRTNSKQPQMPTAQKAQPKQQSSCGTDYANPKAQQHVNGAIESSMNEVDSDVSEEDEYDDDEDDSLKPFAQPPRMPPYDFAKRKLSQLIGTIFNPSEGSSCGGKAKS